LFVTYLTNTYITSLICALFFVLKNKKHFVLNLFGNKKQIVLSKNMNRSITLIKHNVSQSLFRANGIVRDNWFKILLVLVAAFIIARKDLNFQFALNSANAAVAPPAAVGTGLITGAHHPEAQGEVVMIEENSETAKPAEKPAAKPVKIDDNKAQSFSNLGFALNPNYAKRHNIDPAIVAEKQRILDRYIKEYSVVAVQEMKAYGIPASITLAQGLLESNAGDSRLAVDANNHFGIKCFSNACGRGHCKNYTDDTHKDFFRVYKSVWESYRAHSLFLQRGRYNHLLKLKKTDYKGWAHGLKKAGYATDKRYAYKLIGLIEALDLHKFDKM
jgi:flagellum-specific peptidoglycan hydrolase FlgJ